MSRLKLGLAVRKAGVLYPQAIQLALSHLVLNILYKEIENNTAGLIANLTEKNVNEREIDSKKNKNDIDFNNRRGESKYYDILDALVCTCELPKLSDAADKYHMSHPSLLSTSKRQDVYDRLIRVLEFEVDVEVGGGSEEVEGRMGSIDGQENISDIMNDNISMNSARNNMKSSSSDSRNEIRQVLIGCDHVLEALTVLNLTESYKITPLITGDQMKQILKNIPKGTMFGEV